MALPFTVDFQPGTLLADQVVCAVKKAAISGLLKQGDRFPSIRVLSQELRINPHIAQKVISTLVSEGLLESEPGVGTRLAEIPEISEEERGGLLDAEIGNLVIQAKALNLSLSDLQKTIATHWKKLS